MNTRKKLAGIALATAMTISNNASNPADAAEFCPPPPPDNGSTGSNSVSGEGASINNQIAKDKIIKALRSMKKSPESIRFHSAMCYKMSMPPETVEYTCPKCSTVTTHQYSSVAGEITRKLPGFHRSLPTLPFKISLNESALCSKCSPSAAPQLQFKTECGECGKSFPWCVDESAELEKMRWLFLPYPIDSLDTGPGRGSETDTEMTREMVKFVSHRFFCPDCVKKFDLEIQE